MTYTLIPRLRFWNVIKKMFENDIADRQIDQVTYK